MTTTELRDADGAQEENKGDDNRRTERQTICSYHGGISLQAAFTRSFGQYHGPVKDSSGVLRLTVR